MRTDICVREDTDTQSSLLDALSSVGAEADDDFPQEVPLPIGLHRYITPQGMLSVLSDAWGIDLEGPDELVRRVLHMMSETG